jgi:hypothetical protein
MEKKIEEHYEAQARYGQLLYEALDVPWYRPIRKFRAFYIAEALKNVHKPCCEWANEDV